MFTLKIDCWAPVVWLFWVCVCLCGCILLTRAFDQNNLTSIMPPESKSSFAKIHCFLSERWITLCYLILPSITPALNFETEQQNLQSLASGGFHDHFFDFHCLKGQKTSISLKVASIKHYRLIVWPSSYEKSVLQRMFLKVQIVEVACRYPRLRVYTSPIKSKYR